MSPVINDEEFLSQDAFGIKETNGTRSESVTRHVTVVGAGPSGLMLAYVLLKAILDSV
jgi:ribulose 1,5-bisphosphate synthetase/thiazole synthase